MFVSIIIPYYQVRHIWLWEALASVKEKALDHPQYFFHLFLIDDQSPSPLPDGIENFFSSIPNLELTQIFHEKNLGLSEARNSALKHISLESYIIFLDGDDILGELPQDLSTYDVWIGSTKLFWTQEELLFFQEQEKSKKQISSYSSSLDALKRLSFRNTDPVSGYIFKKSWIGNLKFRKDLKSCEDWCFWFEAFFLDENRKRPIGISSLVFSYIRKSENSMSASYRRIFENREKLWFFILNKRSPNRFFDSLAKTHIALSKIVNEEGDRWILLIEIPKLIFWSIYHRFLTYELFFHLVFCLTAIIHPKFLIEKIQKRYIKRSKARRKNIPPYITGG